MRSVEAEALALALESSVVSLADVRAWADKYVMSEPLPDEEILSLCTEAKVASAISLLHQMSTGENKAECSKLVLGHLRAAMSQGSVSLRRAAGLVQRMVNLDYIPESEAENQMNWFVEDLALIDVKEYSADLEEKIKAEFNAFLAKYAV